MQGQMYVEHLVPAPEQPGDEGGLKPPLVLLHGGTRTGAVSQAGLSLACCYKLMPTRTGSQSPMGSPAGPTTSSLVATMSTW